LPPTFAVEPGQLRCGEHVDYGSITLLFQDPNGGLQVRGVARAGYRPRPGKIHCSMSQVKCSDGGYIDVPYMEDTVLVNLGALMQRWTGDVYLATVSKKFRHQDIFCEAAWTLLPFLPPPPPSLHGL